MEIIRDGSRVNVVAGERIDAYSAPMFAKTVETALDGAEDLTLDFGNLKYISSSGLRAEAHSGPRGDLQHSGDHRLYRRVRRGNKVVISEKTATLQKSAYQQTETCNKGNEE